MGEGVGLNDVSDQITDEDQLLGTREQVSFRPYTIIWLASHVFQIWILNGKGGFGEVYKVGNCGKIYLFNF
jgi:hypothetical protein